MSAIPGIAQLVGIVLLVAVLAGIAYLFWMGPRFFGDDPGGRDPNLRRQFLMWGNGPNYVEFLREKRRLLGRKRKR